MRVPRRFLGPGNGNGLRFAWRLHPLRSRSWGIRVKGGHRRRSCSTFSEWIEQVPSATAREFVVVVAAERRHHLVLGELDELRLQLVALNTHRVEQMGCPIEVIGSDEGLDCSAKKCLCEGSWPRAGRRSDAGLDAGRSRKSVLEIETGSVADRGESLVADRGWSGSAALCRGMEQLCHLHPLWTLSLAPPHLFPCAGVPLHGGGSL